MNQSNDKPNASMRTRLNLFTTMIVLTSSITVTAYAQTQLSPPKPTTLQVPNLIKVPPTNILKPVPTTIPPALPAPPAPGSGGSQSGNVAGSKTMPCLIKNVSHVVGKFVSVRCLAAQDNIHTLKMAMDKPGIGLFVIGLAGAALDGRTITLVYKDLADSAGGVAGCSAANGCAELVGTK